MKAQPLVSILIDNYNYGRFLGEENGGRVDFARAIGELEIHIYPPIDSEGKGQVYSDAGDGYGPMRLDEFTVYWEASQLVLRHRHEGEYPLPGKELELHIHRLPVARTWIDENEEPVEVEDNKLALKDFERVRFEAKQD